MISRGLPELDSLKEKRKEEEKKKQRKDNFISTVEFH